jgi:hypothetical protein
MNKNMLRHLRSALANAELAHTLADDHVTRCELEKVIYRLTLLLDEYELAG